MVSIGSEALDLQLPGATRSIGAPRYHGIPVFVYA
jgi:hypothetical protein